MFTKYCLPFITAVLCLALLAASGCQTPPPGSKPLFPNPFAPPPKTASGTVRPFGSSKPSPPPPELDVTTVPTRDDVTAVYQFYAQDPWLRNTEGRVIGFRSAVYFYSGAVERGAFVPGKVLVWLYQFEHQPDGSLGRKLVKVWELSEQDAMGYRVRRESQMGYSYGFFFAWPPDTDLPGKTIEILFGYERLDGKLITGAARRFQVPQSRFAPGPPRPLHLPRATPQQGTPPRPEGEPAASSQLAAPAEPR